MIYRNNLRLKSLFIVENFRNSQWDQYSQVSDWITLSQLFLNNKADYWENICNIN